ncbi:hypothetical protein [Tissierella sp. P1]|nr:hypothetical protein [Tissierella sp. P1]
MPNISSREHIKIANYIKDIMAVYQEAEDLINIGAYKRGSNKKIDTAIDLMEDIENFLKQETYKTSTFQETIEAMENIINKMN